MGDGFNNEGDGHWVHDIICGVPQGKRHLSAVTLVGRWYGKGLCAPEVFLLLTCWNSINRPPLSAQEIRTIFDSTRKWEKVWFTPPISSEKAKEIVRSVKRKMHKRR